MKLYSDLKRSVYRTKCPFCKNTFYEMEGDELEFCPFCESDLEFTEHGEEVASKEVRVSLDPLTGKMIIVSPYANEEQERRTIMTSLIKSSINSLNAEIIKAAREYGVRLLETEEDETRLSVTVHAVCPYGNYEDFVRAIEKIAPAYVLLNFVEMERKEVDSDKEGMKMYEYIPRKTQARP